MKIDISDVYSLNNKEITKKVHTDMAGITSKAGSFPIQAGEPFDLTIVNEEGRRLRLSGRADLTVRIPCDRCLQEVSYPFHIVIEKTIPLVEAEPGPEDDDSDEASACVDEDRMLDVDRLIFQEVLVNWPAKVLCKPDCRGICPKCGTNLNLAACSCEQGEPDPRMAQFLDVFHNYSD